jgi:sortase A
VTTGQGKTTYQVSDIPRAGNPAPTPLASGKGRLVLVTATRPRFVPSGVLHVDADLISTPFQTPSAVIRSGTLPDSEEPQARPAGMPWPPAMWLQAPPDHHGRCLNTGRAGHQTWIVFAPLVAILGLQASRPPPAPPNSYPTCRDHFPLRYPT